MMMLVKKKKKKKPLYLHTMDNAPATFDGEGLYYTRSIMRKDLKKSLCQIRREQKIAKKFDSSRMISFQYSYIKVYL